MDEYFIGGSANLMGIKGNQLFLNAKTLIESNMSIASTAVEVRGGAGAAIRGKYYHSSKLDFTITDCIYRPEYIAATVGSDITVGSDMFYNEKVTLGVGLTGTITNTPLDCLGQGTIGFVSLPGQNVWQTVTFTNKAFTSPIGTAGEDICVKYVKQDTAGRELVINSNFIPDEFTLILVASLFKGSASQGIQNSNKVGTVEIVVPRFQPNGTQAINMTSTGASNTPISGSALATDDGTCDGDGKYAIIKNHVTNANWYDDVFALSIENSDVELTTADPTEKLIVYALHGSASPSIPPYTDLTFTSSDVAKTTVDATGLVTKVATGTCTITVKVNAKTTIQAVANVTIS